jgi:hypothetical protein
MFFINNIDSKEDNESLDRTKCERILMSLENYSKKLEFILEISTNIDKLLLTEKK